MADSETPVLLAGEKTITAVGTAEALASSKRVKSITIVAKAGNVGQVYLGCSGIASTANDGQDAGESISP